MQDSDCIFCKIFSGEIPADIVYKDEEIFMFKDINPQAPFHYLICPVKHIPTVNDLTPEHSEIIAKMILKAGEFGKNEKDMEKGYRLVFNVNKYGGQEVYHIHLHLLGGRRFIWPPG